MLTFNHLKNRNKVVLTLPSFVFILCNSAHADISFGRLGDDMAGNGGFKRPGGLQIIDNAGGSTGQLTDSSVGASTSVAYTYGPLAGPGPGVIFVNPDMSFANTDRGYWEGTNITQGPGSPAAYAVATRTRQMGIYYQSNGDKNNASSAQTMFKYRIKVDQIQAGYYKNTLDISGPDAICEIKLTFPNVSAGSAPPPINLKVTTDEGIFASGSVGWGAAFFNWQAGSGWGTATGNSFNMSLTNPGNWNGAAHSEKTALQSTSVIGGRGEMNISEVNTARAWRTLSWRMFTETGGNQIPFRFPPPKGSLVAIRFNP